MLEQVVGVCAAMGKERRTLQCRARREEGQNKAVPAGNITVESLVVLADGLCQAASAHYVHLAVCSHCLIMVKQSKDKSKLLKSCN